MTASYGMIEPFFRGRMGKLTLLLLALLVWLQYSLWFGKNGLHDFSRVRDDVSVQQTTNAKLKARNDQLFAEIDDLNGGQEAIEERARNELSMTRPGETFYRLVPDASKRTQGAGKRKLIDNQSQDDDMAVTFPGVCAVVPAAGFGRRMQTDCPKQYLSIGNKTILEHSVDALLANARVQRVIIAVSAGDERFAQLPLAQHPRLPSLKAALSARIPCWRACVRLMMRNGCWYTTRPVRVCIRTIWRVCSA